MSITPETVAHVAKLARLELSSDEIERYSRDLSGILGLVQELDALDLDAVSLEMTPEEAAREPVVFRADVAVREFERDALLAIAPSAEDGCFRVPKILSDE